MKAHCNLDTLLSDHFLDNGELINSNRMISLLFGNIYILTQLPKNLIRIDHTHRYTKTSISKPQIIS